MVIPADVPLATDQRRRPAGGMLGRGPGRLISKRPALWPREAARPCPRPRARARAPSASEAHRILSRWRPTRATTYVVVYRALWRSFLSLSVLSLWCWEENPIRAWVVQHRWLDPGERSTPGKTNLNAAGHLFPTSFYHIPNSPFYSPASPLDAAAIQLAAVSRIRRHSMLSLRRPRTRSSFTGGVSPARRRRSRYHCRVRAARPNTRSTAAFPRSMGIGYDVTARARQHT
jgi:hypothetical protein